MTQHNSERKGIGQLCGSLKKFSRAFRKMMEDTEKDAIERYVYICSNNDSISISDICVGDVCEVPDAKKKLIKCKEGEKIGSFHTHPSEKVIPELYHLEEELSGSDILVGIVENEKVQCIGPGRTNKVYCYGYPFGVPSSRADKYREKYLEYLKDPADKKLKHSYLMEESWIFMNYHKSKYTKERNKNSCSITL